MKLIGGLIASVVVCALAWLLWSAVARERAPDSGLDSHGRMLNLLAALREKDEHQSPFLGPLVARQAVAALEKLPANAWIEDRIELYSSVGKLQLIQGASRDGAKNLAAAYRLTQRLRGAVGMKVENASLFDAAVGYLRCAESENCIGSCNGDSCILPIRRGGVHTNPDGSRVAISYLQELVSREPENLRARWLLNIAAMTVGEYPGGVPVGDRIAPSVFESQTDSMPFANVAPNRGVATPSLSGGVVADDFDGDGWLDLVTSDWGTSGQLRFYRNLGDGRFVEQTEAAGLIGLFGGLNLVQADYDNDGDVDVLVLRGAWRGDDGRHPNSLLQNDGRAHFRDVTLAVGLGAREYPTGTAAWGDFDNDGDLDLFVGNEMFPCELFVNDGHGSFQNEARRAGVTNDRFTKGAVWGDFDGDRYLDLYVSNYGKPEYDVNRNSAGDDFFAANAGSPNRLYRNNRDGTFSDVAEELGVTKPLLSFATWFWDVNNDGILDLFAASYTGSVDDVVAEYLKLPYNAAPDCLYLGDGNGGFNEVGEQFGVQRVSLAMGANFGDLNNDGFDDFYLGTGAPSYDALVPNLMYLNQAGSGFSDVTFAGGFGHLQKGHGIAFADFDNDGDQDVYCVLGGAFGGDVFANALFENRGTSGHWLCARLVGSTTNRSAIGARVRIDIDDPAGPRSVYKWVQSGGSFGANPLRCEIGLGDASRIDKLTVDWPTTGLSQEFTDVPLDTFIEITEGDSVFKVKAASAPSK